MANDKRPAFRKNDRVTLSRIKSVIPPYDGKPFVLRDTVLTVSHLTGTGSKRNPWHVVVTDGTHFWHLEPDDVTPVETSAHSTVKHGGAKHDLDNWLDRNGYHHARARKETTPHPYAVSARMDHARVIHQEPTGREVYAAHERDHHITTAGRRALGGGTFALPPGPEEKRRGIKGRLPIDTIERARSALSRASMMQHQGHLSASQLATVRRKIHKAWPAIGLLGVHRNQGGIDSTAAHATMKPHTCYVITVPPTREMGSYKTRHCGPKATARSASLWDYNSARRHDGLPPVERLPSGVKITKER